MIEPNESKLRKFLVYPICLTMTTMLIVADAIEKSIQDFIAYVKARKS